MRRAPFNAGFRGGRVPDVERRDHENDVLGDVRRMVADPFEVPGHQNQVKRRLDGRRVAQYVAQELPEYLRFQAIEPVVLLEYLTRRIRVTPHERVERVSPHCLGARLDFRGADWPRGIADVGLAAAEFLEAATGAGDANRRRPSIRMGDSKIFSDRFGDRKHGARPVNGDEDRLGLTALSSSPIVAAAARGDNSGEESHERGNGDVSKEYVNHVMHAIGQEYRDRF
jgi:hypothetical protein